MRIRAENKLVSLKSVTVPELRMILEPHRLEYRAVVLNGNEPAGMTVKKALNIYKKFHFMSWLPDWGEMPFSCSCKVCFPNCVCDSRPCSIQKVRVPENWVTATVSSRQVQKPIGGAAGRKRRQYIDERACNEKTISSKVKVLKDVPPEEPPSAPVREFVVPAARSPSPSDDNFEVYTPVAADGRPD